MLEQCNALFSVKEIDSLRDIVVLIHDPNSLVSLLSTLAHL